MDRERVIVYIDENTDDGMMYEELNQNGQMQVSVYDEEYEYDVEYHHSIVVKSLQEYLADYTKQVRKEVVQEVRETLENLIFGGWLEIKDKTLKQILDQIATTEKI